MNARLILIQALLPTLARLAESPDKALAAEAAEEHAAKSRELAKLKRGLVAPTPPTTEEVAA
jgi:hypothetical protein